MTASDPIDDAMHNDRHLAGRDAGRSSAHLNATRVRLLLWLLLVAIAAALVAAYGWPAALLAVIASGVTGLILAPDSALDPPDRPATRR